MKKVIVIITILVSTSVYAQNKSLVKIVAQSAKQLIVDIEIDNPSLSRVQTTQGEASVAFLPECTNWQMYGQPDLPKLNLALNIPSTSNTVVTVLKSSYTDIPNILIAPSKGKIIRPNTPEKTAYHFGDAYNRNEFFPSELCHLNAPYIFRNKRGQALHIAPMQYNAITKILRAYNNIRIQIDFIGENNFNSLSNMEAINTSPLYTEMYKAHFINNIPSPIPTGNYTAIGDKGKMLVLAPTKYINTIQPFIDWKNQKGIPTTLVNVDTISGGVTDLNMQIFVNNYYLKNQNTFLVIVGNANDVPTLNLLYLDPNLYGPGDNGYGYISGNDHYPEIIVGRLMARDSTDIKVQIQKIIDYEKTPNMLDNWMRTCTGIASNQGPGDDNQYDFEHIRDITDSLMNPFTYLKKVELYDGDHNQADSIGDPVALDVVKAINETGTSIINYAGHGDNYFINTTAFSAQTHVPMLNNTNGKYPFMITVGCKPGNFTLGDCLAASGAWAKDLASGKGTGFIASAMSTVDQYWNEPMQAQDEMNAILRGARPSNIKYTIGGICVNGFASMNDQFNIATDPTGGSDMTDTWEIFGDPSVELLTKNEGALNCSHIGSIDINATTYSVNCTTDGALATLYFNGKIIDSKIVSGGVATFTIPAGTLILFSNVIITVTHHNMVPCTAWLQIVNYPAGVNDIIKTNLKVYPNPITDWVQIKSDENISNIKLLDITGKQLMHFTDIDRKEYKLNLQTYNAGLYILQTETNGIILNTKVYKN
jgi:gingipain R